ncbi:hypothetical protein MQX03_16535 [Chryseobacterium aahli]|uniref:hypothetical protein n=1 Tax=Chryseobacterium aahli TaxID=1278643 RepID=UPI001F61AFCC|nr:hypothetical protein [Chryseobacterium aahli]MCI3938808.1 hypothetical protein [Chryseobacterium aahli]
MMKKNKLSASKNTRLTGRTRAEIISLLGNDYVEDSEGNIIYTRKTFLFITKKIFIGFDEDDVADVVFTQ